MIIHNFRNGSGKGDLSDLCVPDDAGSPANLDSNRTAPSYRFPTDRDPLLPAHAVLDESAQAWQPLEEPARCHETEPSKTGSPTNRAKHSLRKSEEQELLRRISQGDSEAFWELWLVQQRPMFLICFAQMGGRQADAEDALSRVMEKARDILPREALTVRNLRAWLARLTVNTCIDTHRVDKRRCQGACSIEIGICEENPTALVAANPPCPDQDLIQGEMGRAITAAIAALPPRLVEAARLFFLENISYSKMAGMLHTSNVNVRKRIQEARARLRVVLKEYAPGASSAPRWL